jgi:hypothetical protein
LIFFHSFLCEIWDINSIIESHDQTSMYTNIKSLTMPTKNKTIRNRKSIQGNEYPPSICWIGCQTC